MNRLGIHLPIRPVIDISDIRLISIIDGPESPESRRLSSPYPIPTPTQATIGMAESLKNPFSQIDISGIEEKLRSPRLGPSIPLKRGQSQGKAAQKKRERERASLVLQSQSQFVPQTSSFSMSVPPIGSQDIKEIVKGALEPLIS